MRSWKLWDWIAYVSLFVSAAVLAADASLKGSAFKSDFGWLLTSAAWNFAPLMLIAIGTLSLMLRDRVPIRSNSLKAADADTLPGALSDGLVVSGQNETPPSFRGRFQRPGHSAVFYLEYECFPLGGQSWSGQRKFQIFQVDRFTVNQWVRFPLMSFKQGESGFWTWTFGSGQFTHDEPMLHHAIYRGRVTILDDQDPVEKSVYFIIKCDGDTMPDVTGQHIFDHMIKWGGRTLQGQPESLFT